VEDGLHRFLVVICMDGSAMARSSFVGGVLLQSLDKRFGSVQFPRKKCDHAREHQSE